MYLLMFQDLAATVFIDVSRSGSDVREVDESFCTQRGKFSRSASHSELILGGSLF